MNASGRLAPLIPDRLDVLADAQQKGRHSMTAEFVLPPKPRSFPPARLPKSVRARAAQQYVIDVYDALVRAYRNQCGAVLPEPEEISAHFEAFTVEQARSCCTVLHTYYGAALPVGRVRP